LESPETRHNWKELFIAVFKVNLIFRDPDGIQKAVDAVERKILSIRKAAEKFHIPYETVRSHVKGERQSPTRGRIPVISKQNEVELKRALHEMKKMCHGANVSDLRVLGKGISEVDGSHCFKNSIPSRGWARRFISRHNLSLRVPENISKARMENEKPEVLQGFYKKVEETYKELIPAGLTSAHIFNVDESGLCVVNKSGKVIAAKGDKCVRARKSGERGENITVIACANASGTVILPPTVIFKGKTLNEDLMKGAADGVVFAHSQSSFIDSELFCHWFDRFVQLIPPVRPVLLFSDGHVSRIIYALISKAIAHGIHILLFPGHLTHLLQPLDLTTFGPLKKMFSHECDTLARKNKIKCLNRLVL